MSEIARGAAVSATHTGAVAGEQQSVIGYNKSGEKSSAPVAPTVGVHPDRTKGHEDDFSTYDAEAREAEITRLFSGIGIRRTCQQFAIPKQRVAFNTLAVKKWFDEQQVSHWNFPVPDELWESPEHQYVGDGIILYDPRTGEDVQASKFKELPTKCGVKLTFGQVIYLGGDFYSTSDLKPISSATDQDAAFVDAVSTLYNANEKELTGIIDLVTEQYSKTVQADYPEDVFKHDADYYNWKFNTITGGKGDSHTWWLPMNWGRYMKIAAANLDHFGQDALDVYKVGHLRALEYAKEAYQAHQAGDLPKYVSLFLEAYVADGFACHFLTDIFSAGHMRTPRRVIGKYDFYPVFAGSGCSYFMHNEDCANGLNVISPKGEKWTAFGDDYYWTTTNVENAKRCVLATQLSAQEIIDTAVKGSASSVLAALEVCPDLGKSFPLPPPKTNTSPMFIPTNSNYVGTRKNLNKSQDYSWSQQTSGFAMGVNLVYLKASYKPDPPFPHPPHAPSNDRPDV